MLRLIFLVSTVALSAIGGDRLAQGRALLCDYKANGEVALVMAHDEGYQLSRYDASGRLSWTLPLDRQPAQIQLLANSSVLVVERGELFTPEQAANRVQIMASTGIVWQAEDLAYYCQLNANRTLFLVKRLCQQGNLLSVHDLDGRTLISFDLATAAATDRQALYDDRMARFSNDGSAVLVTPTSAGGEGRTELHPLDGTQPFLLEMQGKVGIEYAAAPNAHEILMVGSDHVIRKLRRNEVVFEIKPEKHAYYTLEISPDGQSFLARRGSGFDLFRMDGTLSERFDPEAQGEALARLFRLPPGQKQGEVIRFFGGFHVGFGPAGIVMNRFDNTLSYEASTGSLHDPWAIAQTEGEPLLNFDRLGEWRIVYRDGYTQREHLAYGKL